MSKVEIVVDNSEEGLLECASLAKDHFMEVEGRAKKFGFNLDIGAIMALASSGHIHNIVALSDGEVIGYYTMLVSKCMQTSILAAMEIGIYLKPSERGSSTFFRMVKESERVAKSLGCKSISLAFKEGHDFGAAQRLGYSKTETIYEKFLEE